MIYPFIFIAFLILQMSSQERNRKFENRSAISSDDFYGHSSSPRQQSRGHVEGIKDGVKEGVRSVAGKLSTMASDLASTIQVRYALSPAQPEIKKGDTFFFY